MHMSMAPVAYTPISDAMERHDYGITKNRKTASTGGGRAWSEDEVSVIFVFSCPFGLEFLKRFSPNVVR